MGDKSRTQIIDESILLSTNTPSVPTLSSELRTNITVLATNQPGDEI
jgi:hypothetical protein